MDLRLPRIGTIYGFFFVATAEEVAAMDMLVGPTRPMMPGKRGGRRVMVRDCVHPTIHQPWFLDIIVSSISPSTQGLSLELVRSEAGVALYRFPPQVTDILAELTPERADFTRAEVASITKRVLEHTEVSKLYKEGGVYTAILSVRGDALRATPRSLSKEVFYWCYRTSEAGRLRDLQQ